MHDLSLILPDEESTATTFQADTQYYVISSPQLDGVSIYDLYNLFPELSNLLTISDLESVPTDSAFYSHGVWLGSLTELEGNHSYRISFSQDTTTSLFELDD